MRDSAFTGIRAYAMRAPEIFLAAATYLRNRSRYRAVELPYRRIYINPHEVRWKLKAEPQKARDSSVGEVRGGDWDLDIQDLDGLKHDGIMQHFVHGVPWQETELFRESYREAFTSVGAARGCESLEELASRYEKRYDALYASMKENGFLPPTLFSAKLQPIFVYIGRNGEILWSANGNHRLTIARILKIDRVPVWVRMRHEKWQEFRDQVAESGGEILEEFDPVIRRHPDLTGIIACGSGKTVSNSSRTWARTAKFEAKEEVSR